MLGRTGWMLAYMASVGAWALLRWPAYRAGPPPRPPSPWEAVLAGAAAVVILLALADRTWWGGRWGRNRARPLAAVPRAGGGAGMAVAWGGDGGHGCRSPAMAGVSLATGHPGANRQGAQGRLHPEGPVPAAPLAAAAAALPAVLLAGLAAAAGWLAAETWVWAAWRPAAWADEETVTVAGYLVDGQRLAVTAIDGIPVQSRLRVRWPEARSGGDGGPPPVGAPVTVTGALRPLRPATNPGGYDDRAAGLREGFAFELRAAAPPRIDGPPRPAAQVTRALGALQHVLLDGLAATLPPGPQGVAAALLFDRRDGLSVTARDALAETGLIHALAVSGQHVAMAAALATWMAGRARWLPRRRRLAVTAVVLLYAGLTGGPPSVLRATAVFLLAEAARVLGRPVYPVELLVWAGFVQAAWRPLVLLDPGFQLSFAATAGLVLLADPLRQAWRRRWHRWAAGAGTNPGEPPQGAGHASITILGAAEGVPAGRRGGRGVPAPGGAGGRGAALAIHRLAWGAVRVVGWAGDALAVTAAAQLAVMPVQVALFGRLPLAALVANLVVVPLSAVALVAAAAAAAGGALLVPAAGSVLGEGVVHGLARAVGWPAEVSLTAMVRAAMLAGTLPAAGAQLAPAAAGCIALAAGWVVGQLGDGRPGFARRLRPRPLPPGRQLAPAAGAVVAALLLSAWVDRPPPAGTWEAWFLDVGQGDAILLRFPGGRTALVDTGGRALQPPEGRYWPGPAPAIPDAVGERVTVPVVRRLLGRGPDLLAVTHADRDHAGGAGAVLERLGAGTVWLGGVPGAPLDRALVRLAGAKGIPLLRPHAGWQWRPARGCTVDVLHPQPLGPSGLSRPLAGPSWQSGPAAGAAGVSGPAARPGGVSGPAAGPGGGGRAAGAGQGEGREGGAGGDSGDGTAPAPAGENDQSLVLRVACGGPRLLLVGDLERAGEEELLRRGVDLRADVLKVAHHGSRGATTPAFLAAVAPRLAVVSVGPNPYGLPHVETLARLRRAGIPVLRTDRLGAIRIRAEAGGHLEVRAMAPGGGRPGGP
ncbi:ComEC/Rec2 family competence protein [Thermaerobacter litoralis]